MNRREFLARAGTLVGAAALSRTGRLWAQDANSNAAVTQVHAIFKTHLDVGFTNTAANVLQIYFDQFIPKVLDLVERIEREHIEDRYVWTTGSWLVYNYLEKASPENRRRMENAINAGSFVWHGLPFTTHTELADASLYRLGTKLSARLDKRFGRQTIAGKMTDVPGHTRGLVPIMADAGLKLLHIGVNSASTPPDVPPLFVWKSPEGTELFVMYHKDYGGGMVLPGGKTAVAINFTSDNQGPHTVEQIAAIYARLRKQFPNARIVASNLNAVTKEVMAMRSSLPVVTQELGDTWIHGPASDPLLMAQFREISRLRREWISQKRLEAGSDRDIAFGSGLLRVPEHTWGLDVKTFLNHWEIYDMGAFRGSRDMPEFKRIEASWQEKRTCVANALQALPPELAKEGAVRIGSLRPVRTERRGLRRIDALERPYQTKHFTTAFDSKTGAICMLQERASRHEWAGPENPLGLFSYQTFSFDDFQRFYQQYIVSKASWAVGDFTKPGLDKSSAHSGLFLPKLKQLWMGERKDGHLFVADLEVPDAGDSGCPKEISLEAFFPSKEPSVSLTLKCLNKEASRLPEALWFSFVPKVAATARVEMDKMGQPISPMDVVKNGNRHLHGVIDGLRYTEGRDRLSIQTLDAFLVAPGNRSLLDFNNDEPEIAKGMHFCLCNNVWGTNFTMWFGEDMQYRFTLRVAA